jgi:hypothetical protein
LHHSGGDERPAIRRTAGQCRAHREDDQSSGEHSASPDPVGEPAEQQQQAAEDQGVRVEHPLRRPRGEPERAPDGRQRDAHDRGVDDRQERRGAQQR